MLCGAAPQFEVFQMNIHFEMDSLFSTVSVHVLCKKVFFCLQLLRNYIMVYRLWIVKPLETGNVTTYRKSFSPSVI